MFLNVKKYTGGKHMKKIISKAITLIMGILFFLSAFSLDVPSWIPTIALAVSMVWLITFGIVNGWFEF